MPSQYFYRKGLMHDSLVRISRSTIEIITIPQFGASSIEIRPSPHPDISDLYISNEMYEELDSEQYTDILISIINELQIT